MTVSLVKNVYSLVALFRLKGKWFFLIFYCFFALVVK